MPSRLPFRYFKTSPEIIRLAVMLYVGFVRGTWLEATWPRGYAQAARAL